MNAIKHTLLTIVALAMALGFWTVVINSYAWYVRDQIPVHDIRKEVKPLELKPFDVDGFRKSMGLPPG